MDNELKNLLDEYGLLIISSKSLETKVKARQNISDYIDSKIKQAVDNYKCLKFYNEAYQTTSNQITTS